MKALTLRQAADLFNLSYWTLARAAREQRIGAFRVGGQWYVWAINIYAALWQGRLQPQPRAGKPYEIPLAALMRCRDEIREYNREVSDEVVSQD